MNENKGIVGANKSQSVNVALKKYVSILPNDYLLFENKPQINGITLSGNVDASTLNLLSNKADVYENSSLSILDVEKSYVIVLSEDKTTKISLQEIMAMGSGISSANEITEDMQIGTYRFILKN